MQNAAQDRPIYDSLRVTAAEAGRNAFFFFFFLTGGHREEIILLLAAPTDNPKGEGLACCANEIQENSSILP